MSQLFAAFGLRLPLLIAQAVNFGVLLVALWYLLYKPVMKTLAERAEKIASGVRAAEEAEQKLATADGEAAGKIHAAETEAEGIVAIARESAQEQRTQIVKDAEARASSIEQDAAARAQEERARVMRESEKEIARMAVLAAEKVIRKEK